MRLKKVIMIMTMTAALGSIGIFSSIAAVDEESIQVGWVASGDNWYYLDNNGNRVTGWVEAEEGDGRGNRVWYYMDAGGVMVTNRTMNIGGKEYTFGEDGAYVEGADYQGASLGTFSGSTFTNNWSNIKVTFPSMNYSEGTEELKGYEDYFSDNDYAAIGKPKLSYDFMVETNSSGATLELYYADMSAAPTMTPAGYAQAMAVILAKTDYYTVKANVSDVTVGGQTYTKISLVNDVDMQKDLYCRKQDQYMVVLSATAETGGIGSLNSIISSITTVH